MSPEAEALIRILRLERHPEGGAYREVYRSPFMVRTRLGPRPSATAIYFLLAAGEFSRWHRVAHSELWHFYEGGPLELAWVAAGGATIERHRLGSPGEGREALCRVPAGRWQTARSLGDFTLVGCTVSPGFEFDDFGLMAGTPAAAELRRRHPVEARFL
jgi:predicted cupin superfamily sugar epimerase